MNGNILSSSKRKAGIAHELRHAMGLSHTSYITENDESIMTQSLAGVALSLSIAVGSYIGNSYNNGGNLVFFYVSANQSVEYDSAQLEDEFHNVDLIVQGTLVSQGETYSKDSGVPTKVDTSISITPATFKVSKVIYGEVATGTDTITYLQHGSPDVADENAKMLKKGDEYILILDKTSDGKYWSYNYDDGIWKVKGTKVASDSPSPFFNDTESASSGTESISSLSAKSNKEGHELDKFVKQITKAAQNKRIPEKKD